MAGYSEVDYFKEASSSIEAVQNLASGPGHRLQLNVFQCQYLSAKLADTGNFLKARSENLMAIHAKTDIRRKALMKLHFTVKRGEKLVRDCCCLTKSFLESAVTLVQIKEDIVDILLDLRWWTSMVVLAIESVSWMSSNEMMELELVKLAEEELENLMYQLSNDLPRHLSSSSNNLEDAAIMDKEQLLKRLRELEASYASTTRDAEPNLEYLLAVHLRSRLESVELEKAAHLGLNAYQDPRLIGHGSFGAVFNVRWLNFRCALKILRYRCAREANSLSAFQHPHIVQFFRYWEAPSDARTHDSPQGSLNGSLRFYTSRASHASKALKSHILMELLPKDLAQHIEDEITANDIAAYSMPEEVAIDMMLQVAKAMCHMNSKHVAHRDLKPLNVLVRSVSRDEVPELSAQGYLRVKLGDFGVAKTKAMSSTISEQTRKLGTRIYAAPEVFSTEKISKKKKFPRKADVWSFGIMFTEILTGNPPWELIGQGGLKTLHSKIRKQGLRLQLPDNCPDYLKFCITSCWELRPQDRPNFKDLCRMLRLAQARNLGLIRENYDRFIYKTRDGEKRLHQSKKTPAIGPAPSPGKPPSLISSSCCCLGRIWTHRSSALRSDDKPPHFTVNEVWPVSTSDSELDVIFFQGNVGERIFLSCKDTWVQREKPDVCWPRDWLPMDVKGDIRVLLLDYCISDAGLKGVVDELHALLVFSDRWNRGNTWQRPIVLVGHSLGCVVIEKLVVSLDERARSIDSLNDEIDTRGAKSSKAFLESLAGCFFYAPPFRGLVPSEHLLQHVFGGLKYSSVLLEDLYFNSPSLNDLSEAFMVARSKQVKLMALIEGSHTLGRIVVPPVSMREFSDPRTKEELEDSNHSDTCKPTNKDHRAYRKLLEFIGDILNNQKGIEEHSTGKRPASTL